MKRKLLSLLLVMAMGISLLVGCGGSKGSDSNIGSNQSNNSVDNNEKANLKTYELSDVMGEKVGVLTYNGDAIEFEKEVFDNIAYFDMTIKNENGSYTTSVKVATEKCADAESYYQQRKNATELNEKVTESQYSEIKETDVNGITVQYFTHIYTMNEKEMKDFFCFVDFPVIDNEEYAVVLSLYYGREDEELLSGLENLLVDVEIKGVKPGATVEDVVDDTENNVAWFDYTAPTELGNITNSMIYQMDGVLYKFPTPLSEFLANGWSIEDETIEIYPGEDSFEKLESDNGSYVYVTVKNGGSKPISVTEGLVTEMKIRNDDKINIIIPGFAKDGPDVSVFHRAIVYPVLLEYGTHSAVEGNKGTTLIWTSEDGRTKLSLSCYNIDEDGQVKSVEFIYE